MLNGLELKVFLKFCKAVRREQNLRTAGLGRDAGKSTSMYLYTDIFGAWTYEEDTTIKQMYAIMYKLEAAGYVKIRKTSRRTLAALDTKGVELVKQLKEKAAK